MPRPVFLIIEGRQRDVGTLVKNYIELRARVIHTKPFKQLDGRDERFMLFNDLMESKGYSPTIYPDGQITLIIPPSDKYGPLLREIANVYWLTRNTEGV